MPDFKFPSFPTITTDQLQLRQMTIDDTKDLFAIRANTEVNKYLERISYESIEETHKFIQKINTGITENNWLFWAITLKEKKQLIGTICLWNISLINNTAEIGYELHPEHHRNGIMQESVSAIIKFGFQSMNFQSIEAFTHRDNFASKKLLEKFNFKRDPVLESKISKVDLGENIVYVLKKELNLNLQ